MALLHEIRIDSQLKLTKGHAYFKIVVAHE
jgi:hypothetical protein